ncbi:MAG: hypothetical protein Q4C77_16525 [Eubacteriales bacterium]|nr:hypothetical protein [Eubacteriales bacterium]
MQWRIDKTVREKALKFKADYEKLFEDMSVPMQQLASEVNQYLKRENLWNDQEAILNVIRVLPPGSYYGWRLFTHYYRITDKPDVIISNFECEVWKVDRDVLMKIQNVAEEYEKNEKHLRRMHKKAEQEIMEYLKSTGLWDDLEAVHEMRCCLPLCLLQDNLNKRYYELFMKENGDLADED